jgi:hypothetical protein
MDGSLQYSALTRLLTLNNQVHDLENQMLTEKVPAIPVGIELSDQMSFGSRISEIQDEIDQSTRASLATCWLGSSGGEDEGYEV